MNNQPPTPPLLIDLNCDLGEGFPHDADLIPLVSSVNIACGGHAGDEGTMRTAARLAKACGANIGAHPGYEDRVNFGRVEIVLPPNEIAALVHRQLKRLKTIVDAESAKLGHVKPHGALYHVAARDRDAANAFLTAVRSIDPGLAVIGPPNSQLALATAGAGMRFIAEGFVDRRYQPDGTLAPRSQPGGLIDDEMEAIAQALNLITRGEATSIPGTRVEVNVQTLCVHGDGPQAVTFLKRLNTALSQRGIRTQRFSSSS